ncbi:MAG: fimbrial biogenesis chaperone [Vicinamibacterales bacterium]
MPDLSRLIRRPVVVVAIFVLASTGRPAHAATFSVNPTQITLSAGTQSALLTLRNESKEPLRFQLSVFAWGQSASGEMQLQATRDIVFFPTLLTLAPVEERRVRIGSATTPGPVEKTYRIFVEELPPAEATSAVAGVRVLTKMGVPIFIRPAKIVAQATLEDVGLRDGALRFGIRNTGTIHFLPDAVKVVASDSAGTPIFERQLESWYVLAGSVRQLQVPLKQPECARIASLAIEVRLGASTLTEHLQTSPSACSP